MRQRHTYVCKPCQRTARRQGFGAGAICPECGELMLYLQESNLKGMVPPKGSKRWKEMIIRDIDGGRWQVAVMPKEKPNYPPGRQPC